MWYFITEAGQTTVNSDLKLRRLSKKKEASTPAA